MKFLSQTLHFRLGWKVVVIRELKQLHHTFHIVLQWRWLIDFYLTDTTKLELTHTLFDLAGQYNKLVLHFWYVTYDFKQAFTVLDS